MTSMETTTLGAPVWVDLSANDPEQAIVFYHGVFGWEAEPFGDEWGLHNRGTLVAGLTRTVDESKRPSGWLVYLLSADVDSTSLAAHSNGGDALSRHDAMIVVKDSTGALVGAWNPEAAAYSFRNEVGAPTWHELHTNGYDLAVEFYENVFEWEVVTLPLEAGFRMSTLGPGETALAGIYDAAEELEGGASYWTTYFQVASADESAARIAELGGTVLTAAEDSPYGRVAHAIDPAGARFSIVQEL